MTLWTVPVDVSFVGFAPDPECMRHRAELLEAVLAHALMERVLRNYNPEAEMTPPIEPEPRVRKHRPVTPRDDYIVDEVAIDRAIRGDHSIHLTIRERAVALGVLHKQGYSAREIAEHLDLTERTVVRYTARLRERQVA